MGKIVGTSPSSISGSVGPYTYRQTNNAAVIDAWSGAEVLEKAAVSYGGYKAARFLEPGQTSANVAVEGGNDVQTGAVGSVSAELSGTNMTAFAQSVALQMASSSATTLVEVPATVSTSNSGMALFSTLVAAPNLWLAGIKVNGQVVKLLAVFGGGGDDEE